MDAADVVEKLHGLDPGFREVCATLYPGLDPRQVADVVYGDAVAKAEPEASDTHVPTPAWRNGRGHTKGRGRRKIDCDVKETRFVSKRADVGKVDRHKLEHGIGLGTTAVGTGISAVALPKHLKELPTAMRQARTSAQPMSAGVKDAVRAVRTYSKPAQGALPGMEATPKGFKTGMGALRSGLNVARRNPRISAGLVIGATALHTANLGGEAIATHVLANKKPKTTQQPVVKGWPEAEAMIMKAYRDGRLDAEMAMAYATAVYSELEHSAATARVRKASFGGPGNLTSGNIKLQPLKAPTPVMADGPHTSPSSINAPKPAKSKKGGTGHTSNKGSVKKTAVETNDVIADPATDLDFEAQIEFAKVDADKMQTFGWCSVVKLDGKDVLDKQGDIIAIEEIEKAAYDYVLGSRAGGDMHRRTEDGSVHKVAEMIESFVLTPEKISKMGLPETVPHGWWIGLQVHDQDVWESVKRGERTGFSIHGTGRREPVLVMDA